MFFHNIRLFEGPLVFIPCGQCRRNKKNGEDRISKVSVNVHSYYVIRTAVFLNGSANQEASDVHPMEIQVEKRSL